MAESPALQRVYSPILSTDPKQQVISHPSYVVIHISTVLLFVSLSFVDVHISSAVSDSQFGAVT